MKVLASLFGLVVGLLLLTSCAGTNFDLADAKRVMPGMSTDQVATVMKVKPYVTEVHGDETHFVYVYGDLTGRVKQVRIRFDKNGRVIAAPVVP